MKKLKINTITRLFFARPWFARLIINSGLSIKSGSYGTSVAGIHVSPLINVCTLNTIASIGLEIVKLD
jgi:hypothetical protein